MMESTDGEVLKKVKQRKWYDFRPRLDFRPSLISTMPPTIDPNNWTKITPDELKAHQQRQEIRGRLRREYWMKKYHPVNEKYFNVHLTDKAFVHFNKAKSVYHLKETFQFGRATVKSLLLVFVLPVASMYVFLHPDKELHEPVLK